MKKWLLILTLMILGIGYWQFRPSPATPVELYTLTRGDVEQLAANSRAGTIHACQRSKLSLRSGGRVGALYVDEGSRVKAGELLLELQNDEEQARIALAEAELRAVQIQKEQACDLAALAQREADRARSLYQQKLVSSERLDQLNTDAHSKALLCRQSDAHEERASAALRLAEVALENTQLTAPFAGIIAQVNGEIGEVVTPSPVGIQTPPAIDLIDDSCLYVEAPIDEVEASRVRVGQLARISMDAFRGMVFDGTVGRTAVTVSAEEKQARTLSIDVYFNKTPEHAEILVGYSADTEVVTGIAPGTLRIPTEALLSGNQVFRYDPASQTLVKTAVTTGLSNWTWTEITAGLEAGDRILKRLENLSTLSDARVTPQDAAKDEG